MISTRSFFGNKRLLQIFLSLGNVIFHQLTKSEGSIHRDMAAKVRKEISNIKVKMYSKPEGKLKRFHFKR